LGDGHGSIGLLQARFFVIALAIQSLSSLFHLAGGQRVSQFDVIKKIVATEKKAVLRRAATRRLRKPPLELDGYEKHDSQLLG